jgi:hypothetical protein
MLRGGGLFVQKILAAAALLTGLAEALKAAGWWADLLGSVVGFVVDVIVTINEIRIFFWTWAGALAELRDQSRGQVWHLLTWLQGAPDWASSGTFPWWRAFEFTATHSPHLVVAAAACALALGLRALLRWARRGKK